MGFDVNQERRALFLLRRAINNDDEGARSDVVLYVFKRWKGSISGYFSKDAAYDRGDLESIFMLGVVEGIDKVRLDVGNPLNYLAYRGKKRVQSAVSAIQRKGHMRVQSMDAFEGLAESASDERDVDHFGDVTVDRTTADQRVIRIRTKAKLSGNVLRAFEYLSSGVFDPTEPGANKQLASFLGVSQQRASQIMAKLRAAAIEAEAT